MTPKEKDRLILTACIAIALLALFLVAVRSGFLPAFDGSEPGCATDTACARFLPGSVPIALPHSPTT